MKRVELRPGVLSHACVDCGRWCRACAEGGRMHVENVPPRCDACAAPYRDNPPAEDGRVYCRGDGCGRAFPTALPPGLDRYPRLCRACREAVAERREEAAEHRALDRSVGVASVVSRAVPPEHAPPPDPAAPLRRTGGFRPRAPEATRRAKRPSEFGGEAL